MPCLFCKIIQGEIPTEIVAREPGAVAFLDAQPLADGHVLVVPTTHAASIEELSPAQAADLFALVSRLSGVARGAVGADGTTIGVNDGAASGQTIPHVHVHIVPRRHGDGAGSVHSIFPPGSRMEVSRVAETIRGALGAA